MVASDRLTFLMREESRSRYSDGTEFEIGLLTMCAIPIVEHLTGLDDIPVTGATFTGVPLRIRDLGTVSVRAFAELRLDGR